MPNRLVVEGSWPGSLTVTSGWSRAEARPWNDETPSGHVRLIRGGAAFLAETTRLVAGASDGTVYSPALYPASTRVWKRAGYQTSSQLLTMEKVFAFREEQPIRPVLDLDNPDWDSILRVDHRAFSGFWRMSREGLVEAAGATPAVAVLAVEIDGTLAGYAIVGAQRTSSFLQRIAVDPDHGGRGLGTDLLRAAVSWARRRGARGMTLNVREQSMPARRLYEAGGFHDTGVRLEILVNTKLN